MRRLIATALLATGLLVPALVMQSGPALADGPSSSATTINVTSRVVAANQPETILSSGDGFGTASIPPGGQLSAVARATMPDLQTRILDQSGPHDPTISPPSGPQEVLVVGQTADLTLQVRNAGGGKAGNVQVDLWLTGMLDPQQVLSASDGFTCSVNVPDAHFVRCTGGTLSAGDWNAAASITISVTAVRSGTAVVAATVNSDHAVAESNEDNDQDARWLTVLPTAIR